MISINLDEKIWYQKYRPTTVDECIIPDRVKNTIKEYIKDSSIPNLLFFGPAGTGKTSLAKAIIHDIDCDFLFINASKDRGIDVLRNQITDFASSVSFKGGRKFIILDEADNLSQAAQLALRSSIEQFSSNCGIIATCNFKSKLMDPILSRFICIDLKPDSSDEKRNIFANLIKRTAQICKNESVEYDVNVLKEIVRLCFPDLRKMVNTLQEYSVNGKIDSGVLSRLGDSNIDSLLQFIKEKQFIKMRHWCTENNAIDFGSFVQLLFNKLESLLVPSCIPNIIIVISEYDYKNSFVTNKELNMAAMLTNVMAEAQWK